MGSHFVRQFDLAPPRLGNKPIGCTRQLELGGRVMEAGRAIGPIPTSSADRHSPVGLRRVVLVELAPDIRSLI
jgi:hypothetical protein